MSLSDWLKSRRALQRLLIAAELRAEALLVRAQLAERRNAEYSDPKTPRERVEQAEATAAAAVSVAEEAERQRDLWCAKYEALRDGPLLPPPPPDRTPEEVAERLGMKPKSKPAPYCAHCNTEHPLDVPHVRPEQRRTCSNCQGFRVLAKNSTRCGECDWHHQPSRVVRNDVDATPLRPYCVGCECPHPVDEHTKVSA